MAYTFKYMPCTQQTSIFDPFLKTTLLSFLQAELMVQKGRMRLPRHSLATPEIYFISHVHLSPTDASI
jgi:hypothetical protein